MITTRFLFSEEYHLFGNWLKTQSKETLATYFGTTVSDFYIDSLVQRVSISPHEHKFLVAEKQGEIVGVLHIAVIDNRSVEYAISVSENHRRQGIGDRLMRDAIIWCRNRLFLNIHLHCLRTNTAVKNLCERHRLKINTMDSDSEAEVRLMYPSFYSVFKEIDMNVSELFVLSMAPKKILK